MFRFFELEMATHIFTYNDPRADGFIGEVDEGVDLDYNEKLHDWRQGSDEPNVYLGRKGNFFKVFRSKEECCSMGFQPLAGDIAFFSSLAEYQKLVEN